MPGALTPLALTMGDPAGIGLELTVRAWTLRHERSLPAFAFIGSADALAERAEALGCTLPIFKMTTLAEAAGHFETALPVIDVPLAARSQPGLVDPRNGPAVIASIERAVCCVVSGEAAAVVTNPISKSVLYQAGFTHPGHTEFLAALAAQLVPEAPSTPVMMIASEALNVVPLTIHIPLAQVPAAISRQAIAKTVHIMNLALRRDFGIEEPRIAVTGLNPHAGEDGAMGREEIDIIAPAIADLVRDGLRVSGPHPADTLFHAARRESYDAVLAMYHDQALIPVKTLAFDRGVNVTLGLPFVRTSPDHGTAFDIAGKGTASPDSLLAAIELAYLASTRRKQASGVQAP